MLTTLGPYGSLLGDGSEEAALLQALASFPRAGITCLRFCGRPIHPEKLVCFWIRKSCAKARFLPQLPPGSSQSQWGQSWKTSSKPRRSVSRAKADCRERWKRALVCVNSTESALSSSRGIN